MKARLIALAVFLAAVGAGVHFIDWSTGQETPLPDSFGAFEVVDRHLCQVSACNAPACLQANNILVDAGSAATTKLIDCPVRLGQVARNLAADAGLTFDGGTYHHLRFVGLKLGSAYAIPVGDAGFPTFALAEVPSPCAWKALAGDDCSLILPDGGLADPGTQNTMQPGQFTGTNCTRKTCVKFVGDPE